MKRDWNPDFQKRALSCSKYRDFLSLFFEKASQSQSPRPMSYQQFSAKAGFRSKSFISDVISQRRRITLRSLDKVITGLNLTRNWAHFFTLLVEIEEPNCQKKGFCHVSALKDLKKLRARIRKSMSPSAIRKESKSPILLERNFPRIYAAMGDEEGASIEQICRRTGLVASVVRSALRHMIENNLVKQTESMYIANHQSIEFNSSYFKSAFNADYSRSLERLNSEFARQVNSNGSLFLTHTFCIQKKRMPEFKQKLKDLLLEYFEEAENPNGDTVVDLIVGFFK